MEMEKVFELIRKMREKLEIDRKCEKMRKAFVEEFGIEPQSVTTEEAIATFVDHELPVNVRAEIENLLRDLGEEHDFFQLTLQCYRTPIEDHDWEVDGLCMAKVANGIRYKIEIYPLLED